MALVSWTMCKNEVLKTIAPQKHHYLLQRSENRQLTRFTIIFIFPHRLPCRINHKSDGLLNGDIQS